ncbi:MAG: hypothetical protein RL173_3578 [Fibrobacterota bacterium]|jgi:hypothetical protein
MILNDAFEREAARPERAAGWLGRRRGAPLFGAVRRLHEPRCCADWDAMPLVQMRSLG